MVLLSLLVYGGLVLAGLVNPEVGAIFSCMVCCSP